MQTNQKLLTIAEAADLLNVSKASLRRWTNQGQLKCHRLGERKERRFLLSDLMAYAPIGEKSLLASQAASSESISDPTSSPCNDHLHFCSQYRNSNEQWAMLQPHLLRHLEPGTVTVYLYEGDVTRIENWITKAGFDPGTLQAQGILRLIPADSIYLKDGCFEVDRIMAFWKNTFTNLKVAGTERLFISGEMSWATKGAPGSELLLEYESKLQETVVDYPWVTVLCQYDLNAFPSTTIYDTLVIHPCVQREAGSTGGLAIYA